MSTSRGLETSITDRSDSRRRGYQENTSSTSREPYYDKSREQVVKSEVKVSFQKKEDKKPKGKELVSIPREFLVTLDERLNGLENNLLISTKI